MRNRIISFISLVLTLDNQFCCLVEKVEVRHFDLVVDEVAIFFQLLNVGFYKVAFGIIQTVDIFVEHL